MKEEQKFIVVRHVTKAAAYNAPELRHCTFVSLGRPGSKPLIDSIGNEGKMAVDIRSGRTVVAVSGIRIGVPFAVENLKIGARAYNVSGRLGVRIVPEGKFYDWAMELVGRNAEVDDEAFFERLGNAIGDYFRHLGNIEDVEQLEKHGKTATQFEDFQTYLPWVRVEDVEEFRVEDAREGFSEAFRRTFHDVNARKIAAANRAPTVGEKMGKDLGDAWWAQWGRFVALLKRNPLVTAACVLALVLVYIFGSKLFTVADGKTDILVDNVETETHAAKTKNALTRARTSVDAENERRRLAEEVPAEGSVSFVCADTASRGAHELRKDAEAFICGRLKDWVDGKTRTLKKREWNELASACQAFVTEHGGEFSFTPPASGYSLTLVAHPENINLAKRYGAGDATLAGLSSPEIVKKADAFWLVTAPPQFASYGQKAQELEARFAPYDRPCTTNFEAVAAALVALQKDARDTAEAARRFLGACGAPWRRFSVHVPSDLNARLGALTEVVARLDRLAAAAAGRHTLVAFDRDVAALRANVAQQLAWGAKMLDVCRLQETRKGVFARINREIADAKEMNDFSGIETFRSRLAAAEQAMRRAAPDEKAIGAYVASVCDAKWFAANCGAGWVRATARAHADIPDARDRAQRVADEVAAEVVRLYEGGTLEKALARGARLAQGIVDNHVERNLSNTVTEIAYVDVVRKSLETLLRRQRRLAAPRAF